MEIRRLNEAAMTGCVTTLLELLQADPLLLDRVMVAASLPENPLHIAAMLGHIDFSREILSRKLELAQELNSKGSSPLHLASAKGHVQIVREILRIDSDVCCLLRDQEGRISLHLAAIKGRVEIVKDFICAKPELIREMTTQGETILHLCVKYNQFEVFKIVEDEELLMTKDNEGNTILHLAAAKRQIQIIKFLLDNNKVRVNALNANGFTALDVLLHCPAQSGDLLIGEMLRSAGALRATDISPSSQYHHNLSANNNQIQQPSLHMTGLKKKTKRKKKAREEEGECRKKDGNTLMVVAVLIATMTFEAGLNPPSPNGDCAKLNAAANCTITYVNGTKSYKFSDFKNFNESKILSYMDLPGFDYTAFQYANTIGFLASLSIIVLIISGFPYLKWILMVVMMIAIASVALVFTFWSGANSPNNHVLKGFPVFWLGLIGLIGIGQFVRFIIWLFKKCERVLGKRERERYLV